MGLAAGRPSGKLAKASPALRALAALLSFWVPMRSLGPIPARRPMAVFIVRVTAGKEGFRTKERSPSGGLRVGGGSADAFPGASPLPHHGGASVGTSPGEAARLT